VQRASLKILQKSASSVSLSCKKSIAERKEKGSTLFLMNLRYAANVIVSN
jgi:hypothetical protein